MMWLVSITTELPDGWRDLEFKIVAPSGKDAIIKALTGLELFPGELLHMIHIGRPMPNA